MDEALRQSLFAAGVGVLTAEQSARGLRSDLAGAKHAGSAWPPSALPVWEGTLIQYSAVFREPCVGREERNASRIGLSLGTTSGRDAGCGGWRDLVLKRA